MEVAEGWKPGHKAIFDRAMVNHDQKTIDSMMSEVPEEYKKRFNL